MSLGPDRRENSYARQKLWEALHRLVGEGPLRKRLTGTYLPLSLLLSGSTVPAELRPKLVRVVDDLATLPMDVLGIERPRYSISPRRAKEIAAEILDMYTDVQGGL